MDVGFGVRVFAPTSGQGTAEVLLEAKLAS